VAQVRIDSILPNGTRGKALIPVWARPGSQAEKYRHFRSKNSGTIARPTRRQDRRTSATSGASKERALDDRAPHPRGIHYRNCIPAEPDYEAAQGNTRRTGGTIAGDHRGGGAYDMIFIRRHRQFRSRRSTPV
jgi:hypothetical protein